MKKPAGGQLKLELEEADAPAPGPRSRRLRFPKPPATDRVAVVRKRGRDPGEALLREPVLVRCGFCGRKLTVLQEVAICPSCGSIVNREG